MPLNLSTGEWLVALVDAELAPGPPPPAGPIALPFLDRWRGLVRRALEPAPAPGPQAAPAWRRAEAAALLAVVAGEVPQALAADPGGPRHGGEPAVRRALETAAFAFAEAAWPPGDPRDGIPLWEAAAAVERRLAGLLASSLRRRGLLDEAEARWRREQAGWDLACAAEVLVSLAGAGAPLDLHRRKVVRRQLERLRLPREAERRVREALPAPRPASELVAGVPRRLRRFLVEEAARAEALAAPAPPAAAAWVAALAAAAGLAPPELAALREAAAAAAPRHPWMATPEEWVPGELQGLPPEWGDAADELMDKVGQVFTDNLDAIAREVRQTGELGQLLAKAASGAALDAGERARVKAQLIELAKVVPALAIFAAPGGMLLLPLLARLLPWNVLPSAWERPPSTRTPPPPRRPLPRPGRKDGG